MPMTARRLAQRSSVLAKLGPAGCDVVSGKIIPSRVRTMNTLPVTVLPDLDAPTLPFNQATGIGTLYAVRAIYIWKPAGSAYIGAPGNLQLRFDTGVATAFSVAYTAPLTSTDAAVHSGSLVNTILGPTLPVKYDLFFSGANVTGDGPPLYYAIFFTKYPLTAPFTP